MNDQSLRWIYSDGGPLLLLSDQYLSEWHGAEEHAATRHAHTDYDRACAVDDYLGVIPVAQSQALVLGDAPMDTAWWPISHDRGIVVRVEFANSDGDVRQVLHEDNYESFKPDGLELTLPPGGLWLFEAAYAGNELTPNSQRIDLEPGRYAIRSRVTVTRSVGGVLHFLSRVGA